jgi:hypothetical protein
METTITPKAYIPYKATRLGVEEKGWLSKGLRYVLTDYKLVGDAVSFTIWDGEELCGTYEVSARFAEAFRHNEPVERCEERDEVYDALDAWKWEGVESALFVEEFEKEIGRAHV